MALDVEVADGKDGPGPKEVAYWAAQIAAAEKRETKYRERAKRALKVYQLEESNTESEPETPFNILFSNTETLLPALYNEKPKPVVKRRFDAKNPMARYGSEALSRGISYQMDNPTDGYEGLHPILENAVLSALIPGRGVTRFKYDADITEYEKEPTVDENDDDALADGDIDGEVPGGTEEPSPGGEIPGGSVPGMPLEVQPPPKVENEVICASVVEWDTILYGYAKRWDKVPWVAFEWKMTKKDVEKAFGKEWAEKLTYAAGEGEKETDNEKDENKRPEETARVWEIWHKSKRSVIYYAECYADRIIKREEDPLGLSGFYPIPEPLSIFLRVTGLTPVPIYDTYRRQARELNRLTLRIEKITDAIKVRGFYNSAIGDITEVMKADDNVMIPAKGPATMDPGNNSLEKAIWLMPVDQLASVLAQLMQQREAVKQVIYEITGISDILRGSSVPSETATAQNIKNQWGTLRLKKVQKRVQRYVRDCFRIMAELMAEHFSEETFKQMTGMDLLTSEEKAAMEQEFQGLQAAQQQAQQQQAMMQPPPEAQGQSGGTPPGAPPPPPSGGPAMPPGGGGQPSAGGPPQPPDPKMMEMQEKLSKPSWGDVLGLLKDQLQRGYSIDVETDSTVDPEATEDRQQMGEVLQAFGQAVGQLMPLVQQSLLTMPVMKAMLKKITRTFRFGAEVEDEIDQMPDQLPPPPEPIEIQVAKIKQQGDAAKAGNPEVEKAKADGELRKQQGEMAVMDKEIQVKQKELEIKERELQLKEKELGIKEQAFQIEAEGMMEQAHAKRQLAQVTNQGKIDAARAKAAAAMVPQPQQGMMPPQAPQPPQGGMPLANV